jgi:hypothetical protein
MEQDEPCFERGELRRIAAKRESAHTVAIGAAFMTAVGLLLHRFTPLPLLVAAVADALAFLFWIRFVNARCPRCNGPFFSIWWILFVGSLAQRRCRSCRARVTDGAFRDDG